MMPDRQRVIRTPLKVRVHHFTRSLLPLIVLISTVAGVLSLWQRTASTCVALGRAKVTVANVSAGSDGILVTLHESWNDTAGGSLIRKGEIIARVDDREIQALIQSLESEVVALVQDLETARAETLAADAERRQEHERLAIQLAVEVERCRQEVADRHRQWKESVLEMNQLATVQRQSESVAMIGMPGAARLFNDAQADSNAATAVVQAHQLALSQAQANFRSASLRQEQFPEFDATKIELITDPIQASIAAAQNRVQEAKLRLSNSVLRAPIDGYISNVFFLEGQGVQLGDVILTMTSARATEVIAYLPSEGVFDPKPGMAASVRLNRADAGTFETEIAAVSDYWAPLPLELMRDQNISQLTLAVTLPVPDDVRLRPGEIVNVRLQNLRRTPTRSPQTLPDTARSRS